MKTVFAIIAAMMVAVQSGEPQSTNRSLAGIEWSSGLATYIFRVDSNTNHITIGKHLVKDVAWGPEGVTVSRPHWELATNWITVSIVMPVEGLRTSPQQVPVIQRSSVTSNQVMVVSWSTLDEKIVAMFPTRQTNTFVLQSIAVPELSGAQRMWQDYVNR